MNRFIFLILVFLFACSKDPGNSSASEEFQKLQSHMWKEDSTVFLENGRRVVSIPPTMHSQYVKFTPSEIQHYYSFNLEAPIILESDPIIYKQPNLVEVWYPGTSGPPDYKIEVDSVTDTHLRYNYLNTPDYTKTRECYYHAY